MDRAVQLELLNRKLQDQISERKQAEEDLRAKEKRLRRQNMAWMALSQEGIIHKGELVPAIRKINEVAANTLEVERGCVWMFEEDGRTMRCLDQYERSIDHHEQGGKRSIGDQRQAYLQALEEERILIVQDARKEKRVGNLWTEYLEPIGATSLLEIPIRLNNQIVGVISQEHVGPARRWHLDELNFSVSIANLVVLAWETAQRRQSQLALRQTEERYRDIVENAVEGIYESQIGGGFARVNQAMARQFGFDSAEAFLEAVNQKGFQWFVDPQRHETLEHLLLEHGWVNGFELECYRADGSRLWLFVSARAVRNTEGRILYCDGVTRDITERKRTERLLRDLSQRILSAQEIERRRVSRELHDGVNQLLASIRFRVQALARSVGHVDAQLGQEAAKVNQLLENALQEVRRISRRLRPSELDDLGLIPAIRSMSEEFRQRTNIDLESGIGRLPAAMSPDWELALYRIIQEALTNVEKHAHATHVWLYLGRRKGAVYLVVRDNGKGFNGSRRADQRREPGGLGLENMRERAIFVGGDLAVKSQPGRGTKITVRIPLRESYVAHQKKGTNHDNDVDQDQHSAG